MPHFHTCLQSCFIFGQKIGISFVYCHPFPPYTLCGIRQQYMGLLSLHVWRLRRRFVHGVSVLVRFLAGVAFPFSDALHDTFDTMSVYASGYPLPFPLVVGAVDTIEQGCQTHSPWRATLANSYSSRAANVYQVQ